MAFLSDSVCRICVTENTENMFNITSSVDINNEQKTLSEVNADDNLFQYICYSCTTEAIAAYFFKQKCELSDQLLKSQLNIIEETETSRKEFNCDTCFENFDTEDALILHLIEHQENFTCDTCFEKFSTDIELEEHILVIHLKNEYEYNEQTCAFCGKMFRNEYYLNKHMQKHITVDTIQATDELHKCEEETTNAITLNEVNETEIRNESEILNDDLVTIDEIFKKYQATEESCEIEKNLENQTKPKSDDNSESNNNDYNNTQQKKKKFTKPRLDMRHLLNVKSKESANESWFQIFQNAYEGNKDGKYECIACTQVFDRISKLRKHVHEHKFFKCKICSKTFTLQSNLRRHLRAHIDQPNMPINKVTSNDEMPQFQCRFCPQIFASRKLLGAHTKTHTVFTCTICKVSYKFINNLNRHIRSHRTEKSRQVFKDLPLEQRTCNICSRIFKYRTTMLKHRKTHELAGFGKKCKFCDAICISTLKLYQHWEKNHADRKMVKCELCGKKFFRESNLKVHMNTHTGATPYMCEICGASFPQAGGLGSHKRIHYITRMVECRVCNRKFSKPSLLRIHETKHTKHKAYMCHDCGAQFTRSNSLKNHRKIHDGSRPSFACHLCNKTFIFDSHRKRHMKVHHKKAARKIK